MKNRKHIADVRGGNYYFVEKGKLFRMDLCGYPRKFFGLPDTEKQVTDFSDMSETKIKLLKKALGNFK